jgi:hypothetical protein
MSNSFVRVSSGSNSDPLDFYATSNSIAFKVSSHEVFFPLIFHMLSTSSLHVTACRVESRRQVWRCSGTQAPAQPELQFGSAT